MGERMPEQQWNTLRGFSGWNSIQRRLVRDETDRARDSEEAKDKEIAALRADNAAMLALVREAAGSNALGDACLWCHNVPPVHADRCRFDLMLEEPHPGAALLEQFRKQEEAIKALADALEVVKRNDPPLGIRDRMAIDEALRLAGRLP